MQVSPIANITFTGIKSKRNDGNKKNQNYNNSHSSTHLKAVPLAALIAMSPLNPVNAQNSINKNEIILTSAYKKAVPSFDNSSFEPCEVLFISTDDNDNDAEKVRLVFKNTYNKNINTGNAVKNMKFDTTKQLDVNELTICKEVTEYNSIPDKINYHYYVSGTADISRSNYYNDNGEFLNDGKSRIKKENYQMEITKDLYDYLSDILDGVVEQYAQTKVVQGDEEFDKIYFNE